MNDPTLIGPCPDFEHDVVELHDGALPPERAHVVRLHLRHCARCSAWAADFAALDARLAADLPRPSLSGAFEARLEARLAGLARPATPGSARSAVELEREHDSLLDVLRRGARRNAMLGATGSATATAGALLAARELLLGSAGLLAHLPEGPERWIMFGAVGVAVAVAGLAWSAARNGLPLPGLAR
jgi:anti-sigma factor RsiW